MSIEGESISLMAPPEKRDSRMASSASSLGDDDGVASESNFSSRGDENSSAMRQVMEAITAMQSKTTYLNHQIAVLMKKLNLSGCLCQTCIKESKLALNGDHCHNDVTKTNGYPADKVDSSLLESMAVENGQQASFKRENTDTNEIFDYLNGVGTNSGLSGPVEFGIREGECRRGRKSKYCNPETKMLVVDYAQRYGPSAAARKFNIPPAVASYYYRKFNNQRRRGDNGPSPTDLDSPLPRSDNVFEESLTSQGSTPAMPHLSGSPGFLRGRGRGRPKLIGDELDANLVDHMVKIKRQDPRHHLTAAAALEHSREYIRTNAPGLLQEEGGPVNLKHTWAMKLLNRVTEREMELAGSSNGALESAVNPADPPSHELMAMVNNIVNQMNQTNNNGTASTDNAENEVAPPPAEADYDVGDEDNNELLKVFLASMASAAAAAASS